MKYLRIFYIRRKQIRRIFTSLSTDNKRLKTDLTTARTRIVVLTVANELLKEQLNEYKKRFQ